ncbi:MAG: hypothetical protein MHPSP_001247 [Paramarteilia canceri]
MSLKEETNLIENFVSSTDEYVDKMIYFLTRVDNITVEKPYVKSLSEGNQLKTLDSEKTIINIKKNDNNKIDNDFIKIGEEELICKYITKGTGDPLYNSVNINRGFYAKKNLDSVPIPNKSTNDAAYLDSESKNVEKVKPDNPLNQEKLLTTNSGDNSTFKSPKSADKSFEKSDLGSSFARDGSFVEVFSTKNSANNCELNIARIDGCNDLTIKLQKNQPITICLGDSTNNLEIRNKCEELLQNKENNQTVDKEKLMSFKSSKDFEGSFDKENETSKQGARIGLNPKKSLSAQDKRNKNFQKLSSFKEEVSDKISNVENDAEAIMDLTNSELKNSVGEKIKKETNCLSCCLYSSPSKKNQQKILKKVASHSLLLTSKNNIF